MECNHPDPDSCQVKIDLANALNELERVMAVLCLMQYNKSRGLYYITDGILRLNRLSLTLTPPQSPVSPSTKELGNNRQKLKQWIRKDVKYEDIRW